MASKRRSQPYRLQWPWTAPQVENTDEMFEILFRQVRDLTLQVGTLQANAAATSVTPSVIYPIHGVDGEQGPPGMTGSAGADGQVGIPAPFIFMPGADAEPGIPGLTGPAGAAGAGSAFVGAAAYKLTGDLTIADATFTAVAFDTNDFDTSSIHSTSVNPTRFTIPSDGKYQVMFEGLFAPNATGQRVTKILKNGTTDLIGGGFFAGNPSGTWGTSIVLSNVYPLLAADYIEMIVYQNSGGNLTMYGGGLYYAIRAAVIKVG